MYTLISATPSPYARKIRIALLEKHIPFTLQTEVPWDTTTSTPLHNPLEKLPILIPSDPSQPSVYESHYILEWLEAKHPSSPPALLPSDLEHRLLAKRIEVVADGICDALVLAFFERMRAPAQRSAAWEARQMRKVEGGLKALATWVGEKQGTFLVGEELSVADVAVGAALGYLACRWPEYGWRGRWPGLEAYWEMLEERESFRETRPEPQTMRDRVV